MKNQGPFGYTIIEDEDCGYMLLPQQIDIVKELREAYHLTPPLPEPRADLEQIVDNIAKKFGGRSFYKMRVCHLSEALGDMSNQDSRAKELTDTFINDVSPLLTMAVDREHVRYIVKRLARLIADAPL